ncbi:MAG: RHS repeat-associated core domain-containing protein [Mycobacterium sp.]
MEWGPGWNGYWYDPATGLWLSRNRWFDPTGGRWITRDPAGYVDGLSLYLYVKGNPFLFRDPSGLDSWLAAAPLYWLGMTSAGERLNDTLDGAAELASYHAQNRSISQAIQDASDPEARAEVHEALQTAQATARVIPGAGNLAANSLDVVDKGLSVVDAMVDGPGPGQSANVGGPMQHPLAKPLQDLGESLATGASQAESPYGDNRGNGGRGGGPDHATTQQYITDNAGGDQEVAIDGSGRAADNVDEMGRIHQVWCGSSVAPADQSHPRRLRCIATTR